MVRVVYRWKVELQHFAAFRETWRTPTNQIHETVSGALGSFLLRGCESETEVITAARWESLEDWQAFWRGSNPEEMMAMGLLGERLSAVAYHEVEDNTR